MAFYSAVLAFSLVGQIDRLPPGSLWAGLELSYVPRLNEAQRSAGYDKPEATNLAPLFPRPRLRMGLPHGVAIEGSWLPPVRVFDVSANLGAGAITFPAGKRGSTRLTGRLSGMIGRVTGPITCNRRIADKGSADLRTYYRAICRNNDSRDHFEPRHVQLELLGARTLRSMEWYAAGGVRAEAGTRFDIGVIRADGAYPDPDHPVLELHTVLPQFSFGAVWRKFRAVSVAGELFYAPGSVITARVLAASRLR